MNDTGGNVMIRRLLALLGIRRHAVAVRPVGQVRVVIITGYGELWPIAGPPGMLVDADLGTALACWGIMAAEHSRIIERIEEEGRN